MQLLLKAPRLRALLLCALCLGVALGRQPRQLLLLGLHIRLQGGAGRQKHNILVGER